MSVREALLAMAGGSVLDVRMETSTVTPHEFTYASMSSSFRSRLLQKAVNMAMEAKGDQLIHEVR